MRILTKTPPLHLFFIVIVSLPSFIYLENIIVKRYSKNVNESGKPVKSSHSKD